MDNVYEMMLINRASLDEKEEKNLAVKVGEIIGDYGRLKKTTSLGRKQLAYRIKKETSGNYWLFDMELKSTGVADLTAKLAREENILRYLILRKEEKPVSKEKEEIKVPGKIAETDKKLKKVKKSK